jgi:hypothetical protein
MILMEVLCVSNLHTAEKLNMVTVQTSEVRAVLTSFSIKTRNVM